ncbi:MAG TPA: hypothetical protein VN626_07155 [Clostridia bacterium]|nr:hypothetical protein [Clostridia bacterium]
MKNNTFAEYEGRVYRILDVKDEVAVIIAQGGKTAPQRVVHNQLHGIARAGPEDNVLDEKQREKRDARYKLISSICDDQSLYWNAAKRREAIRLQAKASGCSMDTIERYLFLFWAAGEKNVLAPPGRKKQVSRNPELEANVKRSVRKYYLTMHKQPLRYAYIKMLQECYTESGGALRDDFPSYRSFKHYYDKNRSLVNEIITREGKSYFCRNAKPVTGTVYDYVEDIGVYLCDATECDISLVSEVTGELIGRPILYMAVDAYTGMIADRGWFERGL